MWNIIQSLLKEIVPRLAHWLGFDGLFARLVRAAVGRILCRDEEASAADIETALHVITPEQAQELKAFECECYGTTC